MEASTLESCNVSKLFAEAKELSKRYRRLGRRCLMCSDTFGSEWVGNRICKRCKKSNAWCAQ